MPKATPEQGQKRSTIVCVAAEQINSRLTEQIIRSSKRMPQKHLLPQQQANSIITYEHSGQH